MKVPIWHLEKVEFVDAKDALVNDMLGEDEVEAWAEFLFDNAPGWVIDMIFRPRSQQASQKIAYPAMGMGGGMISV